MTFVESFIERVLALPESAIPYVAGAELKRHAEGRQVLELPGQSVDLWGLVETGRCTRRFREQAYSQTGFTWKRRGEVEEHPGCTWERVAWNGHDLEVVTLVWVSRFDRKTSSWVIAEDTATARAFATELLDFSSLPSSAIQTFSSGCWSSDRGAFVSIQAARAEDLVLAEGLLDRILADARRFVGARETYVKHGIAYKRGLLFAGPPGNGKTASLRVLLRELGLPVLAVRSFEARYGEVEQNVAAAFSKARRASPCALVLEDVDVLARGRALSALLNELDGLGADTGILTLATTNDAEALDPALAQRPSRFDRIYRFDLPDAALRLRFLERWRERLQADMRVEDGVLARLVEQTSDASFASLQELVVSAMVRWVSGGESQDMASLLDGELRVLQAQRSRPAEVPIARVRTDGDGEA